MGKIKCPCFGRKMPPRVSFVCMYSAILHECVRVVEMLMLMLMSWVIRGIGGGGTGDVVGMRLAGGAGSGG